jgi:hypothetical protein
MITSLFILVAITPINAFPPFFRRKLIHDIELPKETIVLLHHVRPFFQETGRINKDASPRELIAKLTPTAMFDGDGVLSLITHLQEDAHNPENSEKLQKIYRLYFQLFRNYIFTLPGHIVPEKARSIMAHTTQSIYNYGKYTDEHGITHGLLRLPLTKLIVEIFNLRKTQYDIGGKTQLEIKRSKLFKALTKFEKEVKEPLKQTKSEYDDDAKMILQKMNSYIINLQQYALDLTWWQIWIKRLKIAAGIAGSIFSIYVIYKLYKYFYKAPDAIEKLGNASEEIDIAAKYVNKELIPQVKEIIPQARKIIENLCNITNRFKPAENVRINTIQELFDAVLYAVTKSDDGEVRKRFIREIVPPIVCEIIREVLAAQEAANRIQITPLSSLPIFANRHLKNPKYLPVNLLDVLDDTDESYYKLEQQLKYPKRKNGAMAEIKEWLEHLKEGYKVNFISLLSTQLIDTAAGGLMTYLASVNPSKVKKGIILIEKNILRLELELLKTAYKRSTLPLQSRKNPPKYIESSIKKIIEKEHPTKDDFLAGYRFLSGGHWTLQEEERNQQ